MSVWWVLGTGKPVAQHQNVQSFNLGLRSVRDHLSEVVVVRVDNQHERVIITGNGRAAAIVISVADLAELEESILPL